MVYQAIRALAQEILAELKEKRSQQHVPAQAIARVYMGLGETDQAFEWLEKAYEERVRAISISSVAALGPFARRPSLPRPPSPHEFPGVKPMIGQTLSHYRILEKLGAAAWAKSTSPRTPSSAARWR